MNYQVVGPPAECDWIIGGDNCRQPAEVLFVIRNDSFKPPIFRFYCPQHAIEQQEIEARS